MANFFVSFTIGASDNYSAVWSSLDKAIKDVATGDVWDETTSFYAFKSSLSADTLCKRLWMTSDLSKSRDKLVVVDITNKKHAQFGLNTPYSLTQALGTIDISEE